MAQELFRGFTRDTGIIRWALKVDLHKASDSLKWDFIMAALTRMNFPDSFESWIYACISTPMYSVKVNGASCSYFKGAKGPRQGDPISPLLFSIAMNVLSCVLAKVPRDFLFHWKCKDLKLTHLFYADYVLLFAHCDQNSIKHIMQSVALFSRLSGHVPNAHKSTVFFCNSKPETISWFNSSYNVPHGELPVRFLGVPLIS